MATIYVDGKPYPVKDGQDLLQACLSLGLNLPYFCWHPALGSVGACRQCAVKQFRDERDTRGRLVMACMTPALDGTRISIDDPEAREFRASVIEWLMTNHPHDCPVCDEGSECHLQDMTVMTGHNYRRFRFNKRTHRNQYLGPFVNHEMNRCIACYRCVRLYRDYAGGRDFDVFAAHNYVYFGRHADGILESEFSGNLIEVCPTGVFTDKTLKQHYTRKWDLQTAPSICVHCGLGCNTIPGERYGQLRRIRNRYNGQVNGYFLCDRGRFGYEFVNSERRIRQVVRRWGSAEAGGEAGLMRHLAGLVTEGAGAIGIGSPRASLEANFALRTLVGPERFYLGVSEGDARLIRRAVEILQAGPARSPSLHDAAGADAVLVLGEDVTQTAPLLALALRQAVRQRAVQLAAGLQVQGWHDYAVRDAAQEERGPLFIASPYATRLDDVATRSVRAVPDDAARLGFAVAQALDGQAPGPAGLPDDLGALVAEIAGVLKAAERPLVISGTGCGSQAVMEAAANVARALCASGRAAQLGFCVPEANNLGLGLMGGGDLKAAFNALQSGQASTVIVLENDLYRRADSAEVDGALAAARHVVAIDHLANDTTARAEVVLPAGTFAESDGTLVSSEGRAQRFYQVFAPQGDIRASWRWLQGIIGAIGRPEAASWQTLDDVSAALAAAMPVFRPITEIAPPAGFRVAGLKIARQSHRFSGRTAMLANVDVSEPRPPDDPDTPLAFSMEGYQGEPPAALIPRFWAPGWNSVQALNKFQEEIAGPLRGGDPGRRLIEPSAAAAGTYYDDIPAPFEPHPGEWLVVPVTHIFGSEELSILTPGVAQLAPRPYLALNPEESARMGAAAGEEVAVTLGSQTFRLPVKPLPGLPAGTAGLPVGLPDFPGPEVAGQTVRLAK